MKTYEVLGCQAYGICKLIGKSVFSEERIAIREGYFRNKKLRISKLEKTLLLFSRSKDEQSNASGVPRSEAATLDAKASRPTYPGNGEDWYSVKR